MTQQHLGVAGLEIVLGLLHFVLVVDVAVGHVLVPLQVVDGFHALQIHGQTFQTIGQLHADGMQVDAAHLLEVGELAHFHAVEPHFPAQAPGAQGGRFPVVFHKADIVLGGIDAQGVQAFQIQFLHIGRRRLHDDLELEVALQAVGVFPVAAVSGTTAGFHIGHAPGFGAQHAQEGVGVERPRPAFHA